MWKKILAWLMNLVSIAAAALGAMWLKEKLFPTAKTPEIKKTEVIGGDKTEAKKSADTIDWIERNR